MTQMPKTLIPEIEYPESDGEPMGENTEHIDLIILIKTELEDILRGYSEVLVAGDLFWYPVEGNNRLRLAPDVMVVFDRPRGKRSSYLQWREGNVAPQVVIEMRSPSNSGREMRDKLDFYERYGVLEYYVYDLVRRRLEGWQRQQDKLERVSQMQGWVSPLLKVRFELDNGQLVLYRPDGERFATPQEVRDRARHEHTIRKQAELQAQISKEQAETQLEAQRRKIAELEARLRNLQSTDRPE